MWVLIVLAIATQTGIPSANPTLVRKQSSEAVCKAKAAELNKKNGPGNAASYQVAQCIKAPVE